MPVIRFIACAAVLMLAPSPLAAQQQHAHGQEKGTEMLGTVHFPTSCAAAVAPHFDRAVALLHSFEFGASISAFEDVISMDSTCAMAYWGLALSRWTNPFVPNTRSAAQLKQGAEATAMAQRLSQRANAREVGYIAAVSQLYADAEHRDQGSRVVAYERAMAELMTRQPADTEAKIFHALSLAASASPTDKSYANQRKAGQILEPIWSAQPNHPGLAHYIIHAYDVPPLADRARAAALRYASIAPSAAHALHMPSHTFTRVGMWQESVNTNARSIQAAGSAGAISEALHASDYAVYALLQMRNDAGAREILSEIPSLASRFDVNAVTGAAPGSAGVFALAAMPARWVLERRAWGEAAALVPNASQYPWAEAMTYFARALGASHIGNFALARASSDSLAAIRDRLLAGGEAYWAEQVSIEQLGAEAWIAFANRDEVDAIARMREAATREDATEKSAVTPGPLAPARELLGDMLMELKRPREALAEYRETMTREPNRYRALTGALQAAKASGDGSAAQYEEALRKLTGTVPGHR